MNPIIYCDNPKDSLQSTIKSLDIILQTTSNKQIIENYKYIININMKNTFDLLYETLYNELNHITLYKHREWCENTTIQIITYIEGIIFSLIKLNKITLFTPEELSEYIYLNLSYQLYNTETGILNNIFFIHNEISESEDSKSNTTEYYESSDES